MIKTFMRRPILRGLAIASLGVGVIGCYAFAQQGGFDPERMKREALAQPFIGVTTDGTPQPGLYDIESTGVPTAAVVAAAQNFLAALTDEQRKRTVFPVDNPEWRNWANVHRFQRQGLALKEMNEFQRESAYGLLRASLSAKGYQTARDIMRLNHHLGELVANFEEYGEDLYWFTVMGEPSSDSPWGWQIDGHHLIINYFVLGDQVVMTPTFMGSEPVEASSGRYAGTSILEPEQDQALNFMESLTPEQQAAAILGPKDSRAENQAEMFKDNVIIPYQGLRATGLEPAQKAKLLDLIALYVGNMDDGHAEVKMSEVRAHLDETYFAWRGEIGAEAVFYYRIQSPVLLIEFDHQGPIALEGPRSVPTRRHIHTVVRTPNGNDYGKDLLRRHYEAIEHGSERGNITR